MVATSAFAAAALCACAGGEPLEIYARHSVRGCALSYQSRPVTTAEVVEIVRASPRRRTVIITAIQQVPDACFNRPWAELRRLGISVLVTPYEFPNTTPRP